jgi:undecaprenyl-diphosphatase
MSIWEAIILAIVEGITEFLPISSTGHLIIASSVLGIEPTTFTKNFLVIIQLPAILAVLVLYGRRFFQSINFYFKLLLGFLPAAVIGLLLGDQIDALLENVTVVAVMLVLGGIFLLFVDDLFAASAAAPDSLTVSYPRAGLIGLFQCLALIPGVSRSASTIIGGMAVGLNRKSAAEFSFFLAVPTMLAATGYKLLKTYKAGELVADNLPALAIGSIVAFIVAVLAIRSFLRYLTKYGFRAFGWYRIVVGGAILLLQYVLHIPLQLV